MSQETLTWLNENVLIGFTEKRGTAWHYKKSAQGAEPNHYTGEIPIEDVRRRLFHWRAVEAAVQAVVPAQITADGVSEAFTLPDPSLKAIVRPDTGTILGVFKQGYSIHQYDEWLLQNVGSLLDDDLRIGSAGLLRRGGVAWVTVELEENMTTPEGVTFRPFITAATSHDGTLATTYKRGNNLPVCDNTLAGALMGTAMRVKVKHSRYSALKLQSTKTALEIIHQTADDFAQQIAQLTNTTVTDQEWGRFLDELIPIPDDDGRGKTMAVNKRAGVQHLWEHDTRVTPWKNTAFGVVQAVNTADHHVWNARGNRVERNMLRAVTGEYDKLDTGTLDTLSGVLQRELAVAA